MSARKKQLQKNVNDFAQQMAHMLRRTVTDYVYLPVKTSQDEREAYFTATVSLRSKANLRLGLSHTLMFDASGERLTTVESGVSLLPEDETIKEQIISYEYTLRYKDAYPDAHLHVRHGPNELLEDVLARCGRPRESFGALHLPVGGNRFRPTLEDVLQMGIVEGLIDPLTEDWKRILDDSREPFLVRQLERAVDERPQAAIAHLRKSGLLSD